MSERLILLTFSWFWTTSSKVSMLTELLHIATSIQTCVPWPRTPRDLKSPLRGHDNPKESVWKDSTLFSKMSHLVDYRLHWNIHNDDDNPTNTIFWSTTSIVISIPTFGEIVSKPFDWILLLQNGPNNIGPN